MFPEPPIALPLRLIEELVSGTFIRKRRVLCRIVQDIRIFVTGQRLELSC
jgi:hypothetical protein